MRSTAPLTREDHRALHYGKLLLCKNGPYHPEHEAQLHKAYMDHCAEMAERIFEKSVSDAFADAACAAETLEAVITVNDCGGEGGTEDFCSYNTAASRAGYCGAPGMEARA
ncbi:hypothetical protein [Oecophyllibacter saccharovorans]|uniref:Uncharacterized protein n=1 Tax=Oecophyllibacter saccharovorans TaxID=2558360 RepID=A0A506UM53_9PROT|nr:hypothetical protein [Oecophyllibacter saccharovorans]TPW34434.1 hypothetical protein E3202_08075 [Oecophyllibacter saccharovorans]